MKAYTMSITNRLAPAADPHMKSKMKPLYDLKAEEFLGHLRKFGQITYAANMAGLTRRTFYARRERDSAFAEKWDEALSAFEEELTWRVVHTALEMGTGRWVPLKDPKTGEDVLDDDFEQILRFDTSNVDPRITNKLLSLRVRSVNDGPIAVINNATHLHASPKPMLQLVSLSGAVDVVDAELVTENTEEAENE